MILHLRVKYTNQGNKGNLMVALSKSFMIVSAAKGMMPSLGFTCISKENTKPRYQLSPKNSNPKSGILHFRRLSPTL